MESRPILCLVWASGKLGAAYFDLQTAELFILADTPENPQDFELVKLIYRQVDPKIILLSSRQDQRLVTLINSFLKANERNSGASDSATAPSQQSSPANPSTPSASQSSRLCSQSSQASNNQQFFTPSSSFSADRNSEHRDQRIGAESVGTSGAEDSNAQLIILPVKEFAPDACKARLLSQRLPEESAFGDDSDHSIFLTSLISFKNVLMVRAAGALLSFMDRNGPCLFNLQMQLGRISVSAFRIFQLDDLVMVDDTAWSSLQIFNVEDHPATAKKGAFRSTKEGLSIYNLLDRCLTLQGSKFLKMMLLRPTKSTQTLNRRFDVIDYCCNPLNMDFVKNVSESLKAIKSWPNLITKIEALHASVTDWQELYHTIYNFVVLADLTSRITSFVQLFQEISQLDRANKLNIIAQEMMRVIDFQESKSCKRFVAKSGISSDLDRIRKQYSCLPKIMTKVAEQEIKNLPPYINQCSVVYLPEIGYLLALNYWQDNLSLEDLHLPGLDYKFSDFRVAYYKNERTFEMDSILGDYQVAMLEQETNIMVTLTEAVLKEKNFILKMGTLVSELDSLVSISKVAGEFNFVRPTIVGHAEDLKIIRGRHPLIKVNDTLNTCVPNSTVFEEQERIVILTGPNASGKSIYLKQVGIIVLMGLSGSFVPAESARIPTYDRICTKINLVESVSFGMSTFMIDLNQMSFALRESTRSSLVIIDEFGKGTTEADGLALLVASLEHLIERQADCPTVLLSTHFYSLMNFLESSPLLKFQTMQFIQQNNDITYLHKLINGMSKKSFAGVTAAQAGVSEEVLNKFEKLHENLLNIAKEAELSDRPTEKEKTLIAISRDLLNLDLDSADPIEFLRHVKERMKPYREEEGNNDVDCVRNSVEPEFPPMTSQFSDGTEDDVSDYFRQPLEDPLDTSVRTSSSLEGYVATGGNHESIDVVQDRFGNNNNNFCAPRTSSSEESRSSVSSSQRSPVRTSVRRFGRGILESTSTSSGSKSPLFSRVPVSATSDDERSVLPLNSPVLRDISNSISLNSAPRWNFQSTPSSTRILQPTLSPPSNFQSTSSARNVQPTFPTRNFQTSASFVRNLQKLPSSFARDSVSTSQKSSHGIKIPATSSAPVSAASHEISVPEVNHFTTWRHTINTSSSVPFARSILNSTTSANSEDFRGGLPISLSQRSQDFRTNVNSNEQSILRGRSLTSPVLSENRNNSISSAHFGRGNITSGSFHQDNNSSASSDRESNSSGSFGREIRTPASYLRDNSSPIPPSMQKTTSNSSFSVVPRWSSPSSSVTASDVQSTPQYPFPDASSIGSRTTIDDTEDELMNYFCNRSNEDEGSSRGRFSPISSSSAQQSNNDQWSSSMINRPSHYLDDINENEEDDDFLESLENSPNHPRIHSDFSTPRTGTQYGFASEDEFYEEGF